MSRPEPMGHDLTQTIVDEVDARLREADDYQHVAETMTDWSQPEVDALLAVITRELICEGCREDMARGIPHVICGHQRDLAAFCASSPGAVRFAVMCALEIGYTLALADLHSERIVV